MFLRSVHYPATCLFISSLNTNCWTSLQTLTVQLYKQLYKHPVWIQKVWIQTHYVFLLGGRGWGWWGDVRPAPSPSHPNNTTPYRPTLLTIGVSLWAPLYYSLGCSIWWGLRNSNLLTNQFINVSFTLDCKPGVLLLVFRRPTLEMQIQVTIEPNSVLICIPPIKSTPQKFRRIWKNAL